MPPEARLPKDAPRDPHPVTGRQGLCRLSLSQVLGSPDVQAPGMAAALGPLLSLCGYLSPAETLILPQQERETFPQNKTIPLRFRSSSPNCRCPLPPRPRTPGCRPPPHPAPSALVQVCVPRPVTSYLPSPPQWPGLASSCFFPCSWTKAPRTSLDVGSAPRGGGAALGRYPLPRAWACPFGRKRVAGSTSDHSVPTAMWSYP